MTRKCVLCKETNYKNTYSFFSAPKDPETRKKWQNAIGIDDYAVTDDTYVCSKHFHRNDIITHWVSGVPPHVITIKYKKCRLRPGAVPGRHYHLEERNKSSNQEHSDDSDVNIGDYLDIKPEQKKSSDADKDNFVIPRMEASLDIDRVEEERRMTLEYEYSTEFDDYDYTNESKNSSTDIQLTKDASNASFQSYEGPRSKEILAEKHTEKITYSTNNSNSNVDSKKDMSPKDEGDEQKGTRNEDSFSVTSPKVSESSPRTFNTSEGDETSTEMWDAKNDQGNDSSQQNSVDNNFKMSEDTYMDDKMFNSFSYERLDQYPMYNECGDTEMLFEDLLEICTEVPLPRGWSCLVTSKGHTMTIVYLCMGITKSGLPYTEKQVFVKSDMILRCAAVNREIDPLIHNFIREGKHLKVQNVLDVEELIDEFDQRIVCEGLYNTEGFQDGNETKIAYKDGIKWRHVSCPLIVNNDSKRCTKCIALSCILSQKSDTFPPFRYNPLILERKEQNLHSLRQIQKRTRKHDRRYEFIKAFKK